MSCLKTALLVYSVWFALSLFVYGVGDFFKAVFHRNKTMNLVNSYIYEITFISVFLIMVLVDFVEDKFFD